MAKKYTDENGLLYLLTKIKGAFVAKVNGKGLSTNDYTTAEKTKLSGIAAGAEVNVQSDWNATTGDAFIKNKPTIPSKVSELTNDTGFITSAPSAASAAPKADGTAAVGTSAKYAREDHVHPTDTTRVPTSRKVNSKALSADITLTAADLSAVPTTRTVNGKALSANITLAAADVSAIPTSAKGKANGVATLDADGKVPSTQLPSYVDDVIEGYYSGGKFYKESAHTTAITGETGKIYLDLATNYSYRYGGSAFVLITSTDMVAITNEEIDSIFASA